MNNYQNIKTSSNDFQTEAPYCCFDRIQQTDYQYTCNSKTCTPFTGKELDSETGYSYFGARYYDAGLSGLFFCVDPMADKYPSISPYAYCARNPVKLVDPDGNDGRVVVKQINGRTSITISTTVYLKSTRLTKAQLANYAKNAQFEANKLLKSKYFENENCEVSFDVNYKVYKDDKLQPGDNMLIIDPGSAKTVNR